MSIASRRRLWWLQRRARLAAGHRPPAERVRDGPPARRDVPDLEQPDLEHLPRRRGLATYSDCAGHPERSADSRCHRDHLHISLSWEGARGVTSYWTGRVAAADYGPCRVVGLNWAAPYSGFNPRPCTRYPTVTAPAGASPTLRTLTTYSGRVLQEGTTGVAVKSLQKVVGVTATGTFGPATKRALQRWQGDHGLTRTGIVGGSPGGCC